MTGAGHRTLFHPHGRSGTFCTLLKRWQVWVKMRGAFGSHFVWQARYLVNLDNLVKGRKPRFVKLSSNLIWARQKSGGDLGKTMILTFSGFIFRGLRNV